MSAADILNRFISLRGYKTYLAIGADSQREFDKILCESKEVVDPRAPWATVNATSDRFFETAKKLGKRYDIVFVDGLHLCEQVYRDINNALSVVSDGGVVFAHDSMPFSDVGGSRNSSRSLMWNGDVWRAVSKVFSETKFQCYTISEDFGCSVIDTRGKLDTRRREIVYMLGLTWPYYKKNKNELLRVAGASDLDSLVKCNYSCLGVYDAIVEDPVPDAVNVKGVSDQYISVRGGDSSLSSGVVSLINSIGKSGLTVVEIGSYAGESAEIMLSTGKVSKVYCVDPWKPGYDDGDYLSGEVNIAAAERAFDSRFSVESRVVKVKSDIVGAVKSGVIPSHVDLVYIDGCHLYDSVVSDMLNTCNMCGVMAGFGYNMPGVRRAVDGVYAKPDDTFSDGSWLVKFPARKACVAIPLYRNSLSDKEIEALAACVAVLGKRNDIAIVCPDSMDQSVIPDRFRGSVRFERFDDHYFYSTVAYSNLVGSRFFYERFSAYTHVLIYQLDGYVFRDDLFERWMKYDYVGAPWCLFCTECSINGLVEQVGNGGVSLRRVKRCIQATSGIKGTVHPEDMRVFTARFNPLALCLKKPHCIEALEFSLETGARRGFEKTNRIPSFCHKLDRYDPDLFDYFKREIHKCNK